MWQLLIFVFALILRLIYLFQVKSADPLFYHPIMDALYHHDWAVSIINGGWLGKDSFFRAPLYPYFLSFLYQVFGVNLLIPRIIQSLIGAFNCVLISKIAAILFKKRIGIISGIIAGIYPLFIYFDNELLIPCFLIFFVLAGFYLILKQNFNVVSKFNWFCIGLIWGLALITRPNVFLFLIVLPFWIVKRLKKKAKAAILFGLLGMILTVIPITIRNYVVSKEFVPIAWQGGINFYIGNNPHSDGVTAVIPGTRKTWWGGFYDAKRIAEQTLKRKLKNSEIDRYWFNRGFEFIKEEPFKAFVLFLKKTYLFFGGFEFSNNRDIHFFTRLTYLKFLVFNLSLIQFPFGLILPLSLVGIFVFARQRKSDWYVQKRRPDIFLVLIFIICYSFSFMIFFVCARFRLVVIPFLIIFASFSILFFIDEIKKGRFKNLILPLSIFVLFFLFFNANVFSARPSNAASSYLTLGVSYKKMGRTKEALASYMKAIELNPKLPEGYFNSGNIYADMGRFDEAKRLFLKAIEVDSSSTRAYNNLGNIYLENGDYKRALEYYSKASSLEPDYTTPLYHAGLIYERFGNQTRAESLWKRVLEINPGHREAQRALKRLSARKH